LEWWSNGVMEKFVVFLLQLSNTPTLHYPDNYIMFSFSISYTNSYFELRLLRYYIQCAKKFCKYGTQPQTYRNVFSIFWFSVGLHQFEIGAFVANNTPHILSSLKLPTFVGWEKVRTLPILMRIKILQNEKKEYCD